MQSLTSTIKILGAAWGYGARDSRCAEGPLELRALGLAAQLQDCAAHPVTWGDTLRPPPGPAMSPFDLAAELCERLGRAVQAAVRAGEPCLVVGGDHSCAIGTWSGASLALRERGPLGLLWIDAHMDSHTPETSPSGALHGMPLACLLGFGEGRLVRLFDTAPKLLARHLCLVGVRDYEPAEAQLLQRLGVRVYHMEEVRRRGFATVLAEALERVRSGTAGYGISIDLDALDPRDAPGTGTPVPGGIAARDLLRAVAGLGRQSGLIGVEVTELNPARDRDGMTARLVGSLLCSLFGHVGGSFHGRRD